MMAMKLGTPLGQRLRVLLLLPAPPPRRRWSLRWAHPTLSPSCGGSFLVNDVGRTICSMWRQTEEQAINRRTPRVKGAPNRARSGLGRSSQAHFGPVRPRFPPRLLPCDPLFVCTCIWDFVVVSFTVKAWILAIQASPFSGWVPEDLHVDTSVLGSFGVMFIACLDLWRASWSSLEVFDELIPKVSSLTIFSYVNNKLQNRHASVNLSHH
jgi:hypothetical protein